MSPLLFVTLTLFILPVISTIYRVNPENTGTIKDGSSWENGFDNLQSALTNATTTGDQIWLKGYSTSTTSNYYYPDSSATRSTCFVALEGIEIYGGFVGDEILLTGRGTDVNTYKSVLSGDLNQNSMNTDNCYHVITFNKKLKLDRITIRDGNANYNIDYNNNLNDDLSTKQSNVIHKYGGALINNMRSGTDLEINAVIFIANEAINGGALWFSSNPLNSVIVKITNSKFESNKAIINTYEGGYGGAIYLYHLANVLLNNTQFISNFASARGGAIYQDYNGILTCNSCTFTTNNADGYGGAIFSEDRNSQANAISNGTKPEITECIFTSNHAKFYGGAICFFNGVNATLSDNTFTSNTADQKGGAIASINSLIFSNTNPEYITNTAVADTATNNEYIEAEFTYSDVYDSNNIINSTEITDYLDIIYTKYGILGSKTDVRPWINGTTICYVRKDQTLSTPDQTGATWDYAYEDLQKCIDQLGNSAIGGEIWVKSGIYIPTTVPAWKFPKTAAKYKSFELFKNIRMYGGFIGTETQRSERNFKNNPTYLTCKMAIKWCQQILTAADDTIIDGFIFKEAGYIASNRRLVNSINIDFVLSATDTTRGGGIFSNSTNIVIVNSIFMNLFTNGKGGAVYCIGLEDGGVIKSPKFINVAFIGNTANARGGAISADANCNFECDYCIFDRNKCAKKGGAVYLDFDCNPVFTDTEFKGNEALESGGCIAADGVSFVKLENPQFKNNTAKSEGGCLYSGSGVGLNILQGFEITKSNGFEGNELGNNVPGQVNVYLWPYSSFTMTTKSYSPTVSPSKSPTTSPTVPTTAPLSSAPTSPTKSPTYQNPPNILVFVMDDMKYTKAWEDYAPGKNLSNHDIEYLDIATPNIDRIRNEGIVFPRSYCAGPKCAPSRFGLLTGRYPVRGIWARSRVSDVDKYKGVLITVPTTKMDGDDFIYNLPNQLKLQGWYTSFLGKWHLSKPDDDNCTSLDSTPNADIYATCLNLVTSAGFDCVDAFYYSNIAENTHFSHNPEWMVKSAQKCIDDTLNEDHAAYNKPFFMYFSTTLTHTPSIKTALNDFNNKTTPKGILSDYIQDTGMKTRSEIWEAAQATGTINEARLEHIAATYWIDDTLGALIKYLENKDLFEDTMIIIMNDHAMDAKAMLYEQGSRILQFIRYPKEFGQRTTPFIASDYIVSNIDLSATIFQMIGITSLLPLNYIIDGKSWFNNIKLEIDGHSQKDETNFCCKQRFVDMYNSHALITKNGSYIFRATNETEVTNAVGYYPNVYNTEQLYNLDTDTGQQINLIGSNQAIYSDWIFNNKLNMRNYIHSTACSVSINEIESCLTPTISPTNIPEWSTYQPPTLAPTYSGYTCHKIESYTKLIRQVRPNDFDEVSEKEAKRIEGENAFMTDKDCGDNTQTNKDNLEYIYNFQHNPPQLNFTMIACCNADSVQQRHFGSGWLLVNKPSGLEWSNSPALAAAINANIPQEVVDLIGLKEIISFNIMGTLCILCCIGIYCFYRKRKNDQNIFQLKELIKKQKKQILINKNKNIKRSSVITSVELSHNSTKDHRESIITNKIMTDGGVSLFRSHSFSHSNNDNNNNNNNTKTKFDRIHTYSSDSSIDSNHLNPNTSITQFNAFSRSQSLPKKLNPTQHKTNDLTQITKNLPSPIIEDTEKQILSFQVVTDPNSPDAYVSDS